ncbi:hypothetical protein MIN45_P0085 [Methylomarinovum tepidoasis]|uniref:DUF2797 domain-containing protein n=1 Tax=Methylomarinovum tepidoasis TaxID=2840183 RepID=A0AAU9BWD2_9GAMM|nr:DUF2797 domain-containing protein [Methylomarinovum sp. IN45]BCX87718.1 hypothetical protein MIN45_P0085 [Methylomarinovum sp. IN45]
MNECGDLRKMKTRLLEDGTAEYRLPLGEGCDIPLAPLIGRSLKLEWTGDIHCIHCGRKTRKSFNQGYCFPCVRKLARCDTCIVKPELCHYHQGTCREPDWARDNCLRPHVVYLANSSGLKVGITRAVQVPTRWIDQGATQALPILQVGERLLAGRAEVTLKRHVSDRTQWQKMLRGEAPAIDLAAERDRLLQRVAEDLAAIGAGLARLAAAETRIRYPVLRYPDKVRSFNFDRQAQVTGTLTGIKGQYLIFDTGVINIRKFAGYRIALAA